MYTNELNPLDLIKTHEIDKLIGNVVLPEGKRFADIVVSIFHGELPLSFNSVMREIFRQLFLGLTYNINLMQQLIFIAVLTAVLKILTDSFETKSVGEMGFYACFLSLVVILFTSFNLVISIASEMLLNLTELIRISIPVVISLMVMSGNITAAYTSNTLIIFGINIINTVLVSVVLPFIIFVVTIQVINYLTENEMLNNLSALCKKTISWGTKGLAGLFITLFTLNRTAAPIVNNLAINTTRNAVGAIPVVGGALSGAVDTVLGITSATRTAVVVGLLITILYLCLVPVCKLIAIMFIYKLIAALIEPITDKRIVKCIDTVGDFTGLILGICMLVIFMFSIAFLLLIQ